MADMAMFPLGTVLLPGMAIPIQVFEPRYRVMMQRCMAGDREFGVVLIERGSEVGGGEVRSMVGTVARVVEAEELPDGRWAVLGLGARRIRVVEWLADDPYPQALVEDWPDEDVDPDRLEAAVMARDECVARHRRVMALAAELGYPSRPLPDVAAAPLPASYELSAASPLGPLDRQRLLRCAGPTERLSMLAELLDGIEADLRAQLANG